jgi:site-specific recombinase XerD
VLEKIANPLGFSQSPGVPGSSSRRARRGPQRPPGRPGRISRDKIPSRDNTVPDLVGGLLEREAENRTDATGAPLEPLVREWLADLQIQGRSDQTIDWYRRRMNGYLRGGGAQTLDQLTGSELKRYLADLQGRGLAAETVHGCFATIRAFAGWAARENYEVDASLFRVRPPKVPQKEMETYSEAQLEAVLSAAPEGWPRLAILMLLGTGMRVGELCSLTLEDIEDEGDAAFLKIRRGKGAKFRRAPVSRRLRRELVRYLNRVRPDTSTQALLVRQDGKPVQLQTVTELLKRIRHKVGFRVHAHRFRHTFATEYLRQGGEIERLRRILGHTTYAMAMRYVHLDKGDLYRDFDQRSPF